MQIVLNKRIEDCNCDRWYIVVTSLFLNVIVNSEN